MGTRAIYTFNDLNAGTYHVYSHWDNDPAGARVKLLATLVVGLVWELPRFEADEFALGFVATNKSDPGGYRLVTEPRLCADIEYWYEVFPAANGQLIVRAHSVANGNGQWSTKQLYYGRLKDWQPT